MTYLDRMVVRDLINARGRTALLIVSLAVAFLMPAGSQMAFRSLEATCDSGLFRPAISLVLALLSATLVLVTFDSFVRRTRRELGTLKAFGCSGGAITRAYLLASLVLAGLGGVLGYFGAIAFRHVFLKIDAEAHGLVYLEERLYLDSLLAPALWIAAIAALGALLATRSARRDSPIALLRPLLARAGGETRGRVALACLPLALRLGVRNALRSPRLTLATMLGVALTVSVGAAYPVCLDSMRHAVQVSPDEQTLVVGITLLVGVLFVAANVTMTMQERANELSTLWALGCGRRTAMQMMLVEIGLQTACALLVALPLTLGLASVVHRLGSPAWFEQSMFISPLRAGTVASCLLGVSVLSCAWVFARAWPGDLLENLRTRGLQ